MDFQLDGKKALITGSTYGIGFEIAKKLFEAGAKISINSTNNNSLSKALKLLPGAIGLVADVRNPNDAKKLFNFCRNEMNGIDILICNVGNGKSVKPGEENIHEWLRMFEYNFLSTTNIIEACKNELIKNKGVIVCISSICGNEVIPNAPITYSTAKAALNFYVKSISRPLGENGVRINVISPGNIYFETSVWASKKAINPKDVERMLEENVPLKKFGSTEDIAIMATYLSSPLSGFATGSVFTIDGGQTRY